MHYITDGILLEKTEIRDTEKSYLILSKDFGKIRGFYKESPKSTPCDIWNIVEMSLERKWEVNRIKSCRPKKSFSLASEIRFEQVHTFLLILAFCKKHIPDGGWDGTLYSEMASLIEKSNTSDISHLLFLSEIRLLSLFGDWPEWQLEPSLKKLKDLAEHHSITELSHIRGIPEHYYPAVHSLFLQALWTRLSF